MFLVKTQNATVLTQLLDAVGNIKFGICAGKYLQNVIMYSESDKRNARRLALLLCGIKLGDAGMCRTVGRRNLAD